VNIGELLLRAVCAEQSPSIFLRYKLTEEMFTAGQEQAMFQFVSNHIQKYASLPQAETFENWFGNLSIPAEPSKFYLDLLEDRFKYRQMNKMLAECSDLLQAQDTAGAIKQVQECMSQFHLFDIRMDMAEFAAEGHDLVMQEVYKQLAGEQEGILFGWPYLDKMVNGLQPGDVVSYVGRPAVGKTWKIMYSAHHAWAKQQKNVMVLSMEMGILPIAQRIAALHSSISVSDIKQGHFTKKPVNTMEKLHYSLLAAKDHPTKFYLIDGNLTSTPEQIFGLAQQLKPDIVFIDGAYLLRHTNPKLDRYTRVAENIETIKKLTSAIGVPTVCSYQFNRAASKKKSSEDVDLSDIGYSDAIGQISSIVLGLFEDDSVEILNARNIRVMKGREGTTGQFAVNWDFKNMDFSEVGAGEEGKDKEEDKDKEGMTYL
jgi:replicative DNA helicase